MQLSPARGRLQRHLGWCRWSNWMQLSPARGRLLRPMRIGENHPGCNLAPRGDGYLSDRIDSLPPSMQLSPARGRLRAGSASSTEIQRDAAYPREGTVTSLRGRKCHLGNTMQLSPARGRLPDNRRHASRQPRMQLSPARGRLLDDELRIDFDRPDAAYPREGTVT